MTRNRAFAAPQSTTRRSCSSQLPALRTHCPTVSVGAVVRQRADHEQRGYREGQEQPRYEEARPRRGPARAPAAQARDRGCAARALRSVRLRRCVCGVGRVGVLVVWWWSGHGGLPGGVMITGAVIAEP
ncbi:hypothetical protein ACU4GG_08015 [Streptomyces nojiriensis]